MFGLIVPLLMNLEYVGFASILGDWVAVLTEPAALHVTQNEAAQARWHGIVC